MPIDSPGGPRRDSIASLNQLLLYGSQLLDVRFLRQHGFGVHREGPLFRVGIRLLSRRRLADVAQRVIQRYIVEDQDYLHVTNWKSRQRIYHPTRSKLPAPPNFGKDSRKIRESQLNSLDDNDKDENSGESADDFVGNDGGPGEMTDQELKRVARDVYVRARARGNYGVTLRALEFGRRLNLEGRASRSAAGGPADTGQNELEAARAAQAALSDKSTG